MVTQSLGNGGAERQLALTVANLPLEYEVRCFALEDGRFTAVLREHGAVVDIAPRRGRYDPLPFVRLSSIVARWRPALVHSWSYLTTMGVFPACRILRVPYIDGCIRTGDVVLGKIMPHRTGFNRASLVVANTACGLASAGVTAPHGRVIRNGFDLSRLPAAPARRDDDRFTIVMAARMTFEKDQEALLAALRILAAELGRERLRGLLLGDGPFRPGLELKARELVEAGIVEFDVADEVIERLLRCDAGVLMTAPQSAVEGCSNTLLEYMACGLPVVCSRGGGNDELISDGETGLLVAPGDAQALAERLAWIAANRDEARAMGARAAEVVRRDYSVEQMVAATLDAYRQALGGE
jgi:glycosyltransferase involved in cell wall biosynthesis